MKLYEILCTFLPADLSTRFSKAAEMRSRAQSALYAAQDAAIAADTAYDEAKNEAHRTFSAMHPGDIYAVFPGQDTYRQIGEGLSAAEVLLNYGPDLEVYRSAKEARTALLQIRRRNIEQDIEEARATLAEIVAEIDKTVMEDAK